MNYHLMIDDKFINDFIADAEKLSPGNNIYIIDVLAENARHVTYDKAIFAPHYTELFDEAVKNVSEGDKIFLHWAADPAIEYVLKLPSTIEIGLFFWGGDVVEVPFSKFKKTVYGSKSLRLFDKYEEGRQKIKWNPLKPVRLYNSFVKRYRTYWQKEEQIWESRKAFFLRLNYFLNWNVIDHEWIQTHYVTSSVYTYFFYNFNPVPAGNSDSPVSPVSKEKPTTVLLGNSDTVTNNHLEILDELAKFKSENIKLIIPLNYGNKWYGDLVERKAIKIFGKNKVTALRTFMSRDEYYKVLDQVDIAVMNHYRTQAAGNTLALFYRGKKVYIHERSSTYQLLNSNGVVVGNSAEIGRISFEEFATPFSEPVKTQNISKIDGLFSIVEKEKVLKKMLA